MYYFVILIFFRILATLPKLKSIMAHYKETCLLKLMKKENRIQRICDYVKNMEKEYYNNDSDKGGIITEVIFQFSPILKRTKPNQCPSFFI